uniref:Uncharacterized protein n=1 Tax=Anguilla anguilla TaxID=7936 RepID=A0A0E9W7C9_ANGAN
MNVQNSKFTAPKTPLLSDRTTLFIPESLSYGTSRCLAIIHLPHRSFL